MADHERGGGGDHTWTEERLDRLLTEVGPLMRQQERAEAAKPDPPFVQPDPAFQHALRVRLVGAGTHTADVAGPRPSPAPGQRETGARPARPRPGRWYQRPGVWAGLAAALVVLLGASVFVAGPAGLLAVGGVLAFAAVLVIRARLGQ